MRKYIAIAGFMVCLIGTIAGVVRSEFFLEANTFLIFINALATYLFINIIIEDKIERMRYSA